jgi:membrane-bound acyltransferase YfiQ involved in biofilm formation
MPASNTTTIASVIIVLIFCCFFYGSKLDHIAIANAIQIQNDLSFRGFFVHFTVCCRSNKTMLFQIEQHKTHSIP